MKLSISMTRWETLLGWSYLLISMFVLPLVIDFLNGLLAEPFSDTVINLVYFGLNFLAVVVIFHRFLLSSVKVALGAPWRCLRFAALGFGIYYLALLLISRGIAWIYPDFSNVNDNTVIDLFHEHSSLMAFTTVFLVPVTEEVLYRGVLFQGLQRKTRLFAYLISTLVFAWIHVMGYVGLYDWLTLLLCFVQYLPAGLSLAWAYEEADNIITPILIHITVNQIGISAMR